MDDKCIILLIINIDTSDNLCRHLKTEKLSPSPGPPPLQYSICMARWKCKGKLEKRNMDAHMDKGDADSSICA